ncbi:MAG: alpha/beta hydrolase family protein [Bacteroidales bacterium]
MRRSTILFSSVCLSLSLFAQKKVLDHTVYDSWKQVDRTVLTDKGDFISYEVNPQKGDGILFLENASGKELLKINRGTGLRFFDNDKFATFVVKPFADSLRMAKFNKVKKDKMPVDTTYLYNIVSGTREQLPLKSVVSSTKEAPLLFIKHEITIPKDTANKKSKEKKYQRLTVRNLETNDSVLIDSIGKYAFDKRGNFLIYSIEADSTKAVYITDLKRHVQLFNSRIGKITRVVLDENGGQGAFLATADTSEVAVPQLFYFNTSAFKSKKFNPSKFKAKEILVKEETGLPHGYGLSSDLRFSKENACLFFSYAELPKKKEKDSLLAEEKFSLDLWSTSDTLNMPQQIANKKSILSETFSAVYKPEEDRWMVLTNPVYSHISMPAQDNAPYALSIDTKNYVAEMNWQYPYARDLYLVDLKTGKREEFLNNAMVSGTRITPDGAFVVFFDLKTQKWNSFDTKKKVLHQISEGIEYPLFDEANDKPEDPSPYGSFGLSPDFRFIYIYDKYDLWKLDLTGVQKPLCITNGWGRQHNKRLRYADLTFDNYKNIVDTKKDMMLISFDFGTKENGFYRMKEGEVPQELMEGPYKYTLKAVSKDAGRILYSRENYNEFRDIWVSNTSFSDSRKVSDANPQMKDYKWGSVELMKWNDFNGEEVEGLLYKPENYDPEKKYPVIVYFYETHTEDMYKHHQPQPSWSIIIPSMFTSDDYVVFMPDIKYTTGYPGESCYNSVVSGANALVDRGIADAGRIGLQGQSWGGYQIAYLVTRTNMFKCASPGAPVSNMTSAYSGIRTSSGMVRMFQYEHGQSRIGDDLWSAPMRYIENSPVFYAPKVETPLLIRHDDADEAVPFSQGVELFMALKRCGKTAWMLNYNNEPHNLKSRPARMDWTIRMHQFFDYYLKDKPAPRWMTEGISIKEKGKDQKYDSK